MEIKSIFINGIRNNEKFIWAALVSIYPYQKLLFTIIVLG